MNDAERRRLNGDHAAWTAWGPYLAERAIKSNNARVLCLGGLVVGKNVAPLLVDHWLEGEFAGGNSGRKVDKIKDLDRRERSGHDAS